MKPPQERKWHPPSPEMIRRYDDMMSRFPGIERRTMFGCPCSFVNGQMFSALHENALALRLAEEDRRDLLKIGGASPFEPLPGRVMREYIVIPPAIAGREEELHRWLHKAFHYARSLPPKSKKSAKK